MGGDGESATGQWFVDWNSCEILLSHCVVSFIWRSHLLTLIAVFISVTCIQDQLGTLANSWDILHNSEQECCDSMVPWNDAC